MGANALLLQREKCVDFSRETHGFSCPHGGMKWPMLHLLGERTSLSPLPGPAILWKVLLSPSLPAGKFLHHKAKVSLVILLLCKWQVFNNHSALSTKGEEDVLNSVDDVAFQPH